MTKRISKESLAAALLAADLTVKGDAHHEAEVAAVWAALPDDSGDEAAALDDTEHLRTLLVLHGAHRLDCGSGAEFPWTCTCGYTANVEAISDELDRAAELRGEVEHWKGNHKAMVALKQKMAPVVDAAIRWYRANYGELGAWVDADAALSGAVRDFLAVPDAAKEPK